MAQGSIAEDVGKEMDSKKKKKKKGKGVGGFKKYEEVMPLPNPKPGERKPLKKIPPMKKGTRNKMKEL